MKIFARTRKRPFGAGLFMAAAKSIAVTNIAILFPSNQQTEAIQFTVREIEDASNPIAANIATVVAYHDRTSLPQMKRLVL